MEEKKKFTPVDPVMVMLKIQQALIDNPGAKWIELSGYRKYRTYETVQFERGISPINLGVDEKGVAPTKLEFDKWIVTRWYIPADALIEVLDTNAQVDSLGGAAGVVAAYNIHMPESTMAVIQVPKNSHLDILVRDAGNPSTAVKIKNHVLQNLYSMYRIVNTAGKPQKKHREVRLGLTMKNWKILTKEPKFDTMIKMENVTPKTKYAFSTAWKKKEEIVVDRFQLDVKDLMNNVVDGK